MSATAENVRYVKLLLGQTSLSSSTIVVSSRSEESSPIVTTAAMQRFYSFGQPNGIQLEINPSPDGTILIGLVYGKGFADGPVATSVSSDKPFRRFRSNWEAPTSWLEWGKNGNDDRQLVLSQLEDIATICIQHKKLPDHVQSVGVYWKDDLLVTVSKDNLLDDQLCVAVDDGSAVNE